MSILEVNGLKKVYSTRLGGNKVEALKNVNFSVSEGEYVAIMGESGSGKTTLLNILAALDRPTSGSVMIDGRDLSKIKDSAVCAFRRDNLGFVFQDFNLLDTFTVEDNIYLPLVLAGKSYDEMHSRLEPIAKRLGITELLKKYPYEISGGQKQRAAVARALITEPRMILADEPTGALDSKSTDELLRLFTEVNALGQTILMVTHSVKAASSAKRVLFIKDGDSAVNIASSIYIFVPDFKSAATDFAKPENHNGVRTVNYKYFRFFDTDLDTAGERALCNDYIDATKPVMSSYGNMMSFSIDSCNVGRDDYYSTFGSLFYLGVMLSVVFIFAAVLIIYYKQVSEGYEDQSRFEIMQKVGMTKKEIRKSINSQLLTVFFLPLAGAGLHMIFASIIIRRILLAFNFNNPVLFAVTTLVCFVVFALFYTLIYRVTSNAYYKIVSGAKERE